MDIWCCGSLARWRELYMKNVIVFRLSIGWATNSVLENILFCFTWKVINILEKSFKPYFSGIHGRMKTIYQKTSFKSLKIVNSLKNFVFSLKFHPLRRFYIIQISTPNRIIYSFRCLTFKIPEYSYIYESTENNRDREEQQLYPSLRIGFWLQNAYQKLEH